MLNFSEIPDSNSSSNNLISELYPKLKVEGDVSEILAPLKGVGIESFQYELISGVYHAIKLVVYKTVEGTDLSRSYTATIWDFFNQKTSTTDEAQQKRENINGNYILSTIRAFYPNLDLNKLGQYNITSMEELATAFNEVCVFPSPINPDIEAKVVFRDAEGTKPQYNLSNNFPIVGKEGELNFKITGDFKYQDKIKFRKIQAPVDDMLGVSTGLPGTGFVGLPNL